MSLQIQESRLGVDVSLLQSATPLPVDRSWFAIYTLPQNEKAVVKHLALREVESFLPTYETVRIWKNRQRVRTTLPLFPSYLFVRINCRQRARVLESPGVVNIIGNSREHIPVPDSTIEILRSGVQKKNIEPYRELVVGKKVRITCGSMQGLQGVLVRKGNGLRFVLSLDMINQYAAIEIRAEDLELVSD